MIDSNNTIKSKVMKLAHKKYTSIKNQYPSLTGVNLSKLWAKVLKWAWKVCFHNIPINMWADGVQDAIRAGFLSLVQGEKVYCGVNTTPSYYVAHNARTIHLVHWQGSEKATKEKLDYAIKNTRIA